MILTSDSNENAIYNGESSVIIDYSEYVVFDKVSYWT